MLHLVLSESASIVTGSYATKNPEGHRVGTTSKFNLSSKFVMGAHDKTGKWPRGDHHKLTSPNSQANIGLIVPWNDFSGSH